MLHYVSKFIAQFSNTKENEINFRKSYYNIHMCTNHSHRHCRSSVSNFFSCLIAFPLLRLNSFSWFSIWQFMAHNKSISQIRMQKVCTHLGYWIIRRLQLNIQILSRLILTYWVTQDHNFCCHIFKKKKKKRSPKNKRKCDYFLQKLNFALQIFCNKNLDEILSDNLQKSAQHFRESTCLQRILVSFEFFSIVCFCSALHIYYSPSYHFIISNTQNIHFKYDMSFGFYIMKSVNIQQSCSFSSPSQKNDCTAARFFRCLNLRPTALKFERYIDRNLDILCFLLKIEFSSPLMVINWFFISVNGNGNLVCVCQSVLVSLNQNVA